MAYTSEVISLKRSSIICLQQKGSSIRQIGSKFHLPPSTIEYIVSKLINGGLRTEGMHADPEEPAADWLA